MVIIISSTSKHSLTQSSIELFIPPPAVDVALRFFDAAGPAAAGPASATGYLSNA